MTRQWTGQARQERRAMKEQDRRRHHSIRGDRTGQGSVGRTSRQTRRRTIQDMTRQHRRRRHSRAVNDTVRQSSVTPEKTKRSRNKSWQDCAKKRPHQYTAQHGTTRHGMPRKYNFARYTTVPYHATPYGKVQGSTVRHSRIRRSTIHYSTARPRLKRAVRYPSSRKWAPAPPDLL